MTWPEYLKAKQHLNGKAMGPLRYWKAQWLYEQGKITLAQRNLLLDT